MRRFGGLAFMFALAFANESAGATEIETALGRTSIDGRPERVAVFDIAAIDTLERLGVKLAGAPRNVFVPELTRATASAKKVGTLFEPDLEALSALQPDLVIVGGRSRRARVPPHGSRPPST